MKIKNCYKYLIICFGLLAFANVSFAADSVPITGIAYGDKVGLIHFDYKTACLEDVSNVTDPTQCLNKSNVAYNNTANYLGPTKQFYAGPYNPYYFAPGSPGTKNPTTFIPGPSDVTVQISTNKDDCFISGGGYQEGCLLKGFAWSDKLGWIALDGIIISSSISGGAFEEKWYPRIKMRSSVEGKVALTGFAWNEYTGWIMLSMDESGVDGVVANPDSQTKDNWGVWLDYEKPSERVITNRGPLTFTTSPGLLDETEKLGRRLEGYAWSERLGWIKFSKTGADNIDFKTLTLWTPDQTPPIPLAPDKLWFAAGVNSGYPSTTIVPQNIAWNEFATDPESGIDKNKSKIYIEKLTGGEDGPECSDSYTPLKISLTGSPEFQKAAGRMTYPLPTKYDVLGAGDMMRLILPSMAWVRTVLSGYCKYQVEAEIWNDVNNVIYIGDHFQPDDPPKAHDEKYYFDPITIYVRAGDYSAYGSSKATGSPISPVLSPTPPSAYSDGNESVTYKVGFKDIAQNPIIDVACGASGDPYYQYDGCPGRKVVLTSNISNQLIYDLTKSPLGQIVRPVLHDDTYISGTAIAFTEDDDTTKTETFADGNSLNWPVRVHSILDNNNWDIEINQVGYSYPMTFASFAPSGNFIQSGQCADTCPTISKKFYINSFNYKVYNEKLPETSKEIDIPSSPPIPFPPDFKPVNTASEVPACYDDKDATTTPPCANIPFPTAAVPVLRVATTGVINTTRREIAFNPAIKTESPKISGEITGVSNVLTLSYPADLSFDIKNYSKSLHITSSNNSGLSFDNIIQYYGNASAALMESHRINETTGSDHQNTDDKLAWSDPFEFCTNCTRYEMYMNEGHNYGTPMVPIEPNNTPFLDFFEQFHSGSKFYYNDDALTPANIVLSSEVSAKASAHPEFDTSQLPDGYLANEIGDDGRYGVTGLASIPQKYDPIKTDDVNHNLTDPFNYPPGYIDRSDATNLDLTAGATLPKQIRFYPEKLVPVTLTGLKLRLIHEIAYRFEEQILYTSYALDMPLLKDVEVKDVGLEAKGTVAGEQIVTGREFEVVSTAGTRKLQEEMRRNVAEMLAGVDTTKCQLSDTETVLTNFDKTPGNCVIEDAVNKTMFAYYEGNENQTLTLGLEDVTGNLTAPDFPYTIIVKGGANVFIKSNIVYVPGSSFGIIVIADTIGVGANTYISPDPTNISAVLYTEGSILSRSIKTVSQDSIDFLYYGGAKGNIQDLANQLYWRGSFASRNTIAGAGQKKIPTGVKCLDSDTTFNCAQRYDMDYLRRFTVVIDKTSVPPNFTIIANNGKFSGGGSCNSSSGMCEIGGLPTVVELDSSGHIDELKSQLATVYVEKDSATLNNPPPGFSVTFGLESIQEIR